MHEILRFFSSFFRWFSKQKNKFSSISQDEEKRLKSIFFGVNSILFILIGFTLSALAFFGGIWLVSQGAAGFFGAFFSVILGIIFLILGGVMMLVMFIYSLFSSIFQLKMNRKIVGVFSLLICLAVTAGGITLGLILLNNTF